MNHLFSSKRVAPISNSDISTIKNNDIKTIRTFIRMFDINDSDPERVVDELQIIASNDNDFILTYNEIMYHINYICKDKINYFNGPPASFILLKLIGTYVDNYNIKYIYSGSTKLNLIKKLDSSFAYIYQQFALYDSKINHNYNGFTAQQKEQAISNIIKEIDERMIPQHHGGKQINKNNKEYINYKFQNKVYRRIVKYDGKKKYIILNKKKVYIK